MHLYYNVMSAPQPLGLMFVAATERGVRHLQFMDGRSLKRVLADLAPSEPGATWEMSVERLRPVSEVLEQWFVGGEKELRLPLDVAGTDFQREVWRRLVAIPFGETRSYGDIARQIGQPTAARAVGLAVNQNPVLIVIPCHRVIGADGKLVGYSGGLARKRELLDLERRFHTMGPIDGDRVIEEATVKPAAARAAKAPTKPATKAAAGARRPATKKAAKPATRTPRRAD